jgi:predicted outer membrane repeat protein
VKKIKKQPITKKHLIPLAFLCLILLFCLNTASAASDIIYVNNETGNDANDGQSAIWNGTSGPKLTIKNATQTVTTGGTVNIADGTYKGTGNTQLIISKNMTINGQSKENTIIDGENTNWIFQIAPGFKVILQNFKITNATGNEGSAIYNNSGTLICTDCVFTGNDASNRGGAIYNLLGELTCTDCVFTGNDASYQGGAIYNYGGTLACTGCVFTNNTASDSGGAIYNLDELICTDCDFTVNEANYGGGAILNHDELICTDCDFTGNEANYGGAIYNTFNMTVTDSTFTENSAYCGGAIYNIYGDLTVTDSTFTENSVGFGGMGGAIFNSATMNVTGSTFTENTTDESFGYGAAIINQGNLNVTDSDFIENESQSGVIYNNNGDLTVTGSNFTKNTGVAIFNMGTATVTGSTFTENTAFEGGAINGQGSLTVINSIFTENTATGGNGGAIYFNGTNLAVTGSTFTENTAENYGGAICNNGISTVTGSNFTGNNATYGKAIGNTGDLTVHYSRFVGNNVQQGSTIYNGSSNVIDLLYNWWGSNLGPGNAIIGNANYDQWLIMSINADPDTINTGETSLITADVYTDSEGTDHSADADQFFSGAEVNFTTDLGNVGSKSTTVDWNHGQAFATLRADEGPGTATVTAADGTEEVSTTVNIQSEEPKEPTTTTVSDISGHAGDSVDLAANVTAENGAIVDGGTVNFTVNGVSAGSAMVNNGQASTSWTIPSNWTAGTYEIVAEYQGTDDYEASQGQNTLTVIPSASLYLKVTSSNDSPRVGETFTLTYKLANKGPDPAKKVTITFQVQEGLEFVNIKVDNGTYTYDPETRTVTWTLNYVPVGDPYLYLTVKALESEEIVITNYITSETYNISSSTSTVNINVLPASNGGNDSKNTANAATIPMKNTGTPLNYLVMAILMVITGLLVPKRKK